MPHEHLLIDQTRQNPETVEGSVGARLAQLTMMATFRERWEELLEQASRLMGRMYRADRFDAVALHVEYVLAAQPEERHPAFGEVLRRNVPGRGGELMNYVERMVERGRREGMSNVERMVEQGRQEGRQEGELRGRLQAAQGLLGRDVPWSTIEAAYRHRRGRLPAPQAAVRRQRRRSRRMRSEIGRTGRFNRRPPGQQFDDNGAGHAE